MFGYIGNAGAPLSALNREGGRPMRKTFIFSLALSSLVAGCCAGQEKPTVEEASGISSRVVDCEQKAADRYDDGRSTISELAQRIISICAVELTKARLALNLSLHDPQIQLDELKHTAEIVGEARKSRVLLENRLPTHVFSRHSCLCKQRFELVESPPGRQGSFNEVVIRRLGITTSACPSQECR
jgi:hypothetical protein